MSIFNGSKCALSELLRRSITARFQFVKTYKKKISLIEWGNAYEMTMGLSKCPQC